MWNEASIIKKILLKTIEAAMEISTGFSILFSIFLICVFPSRIFSQGGDLLKYEIYNYTFAVDEPWGFIRSPGNTTTAYIRSTVSPCHHFVRYKSNLLQDESFSEGGRIEPSLTGTVNI